LIRPHAVIDLARLVVDIDDIVEAALRLVPKALLK